MGGEPIVPGGPAVPVDNGTVQLTPEGKLIFTPDPDWHGETTFEYTVKTDTGTPETAKVTVTVTPENDPPVPVGEIPAQENEDSTPDVSLDLTPYFDDVDLPDGDTLTYTVEGLPPGLSFDPKTGLITGTIDPSASQGGPDGDGKYPITVTVTDSEGKTTEQTFTWTVTNPVPEAQDDTAETPEDNPVSGNVLGGEGAGDGDIADTDPDGDELTVTGFVVAGDSTEYGAGQTATIAGVGTLVIGSDGDYTFTPEPNWNGDVPTVTYTIEDVDGATDTATLNITVTPVNDVPVPVGEIPSQVNDDSTPGISLDLTPYFDDVDLPEGDTLTYTVEGLPPGLSYNPETGVITGTIGGSDSQGGPDGDGKYPITVTVTDSGGETTELNRPVDHAPDSTRVHKPAIMGEYALRQAVFSYDGKIPALRVRELNIQPGERIAVLGRNGAGKSTLLQALSGLLEPQAGTVLLDSVTLGHIDPDDVRRDVALLTQQARLFHGSLRENLKLGAPHATDAEIVTALHAVDAWKFVQQLPLGLDYPVQEGGGGLSGGQRQSLLLARLMLRKPTVLLLDEPTAMLDEVAERAVIAQLKKLSAGRSLIVATHRPALLEAVDRVLVVDGGTIVMDGPRDKILEDLRRPKKPVVTVKAGGQA